MEIVRLHELEPAVLAERVAAVIRRGGVAAVPTDTVYGLVCDAAEAAAVQRMFAMKARPQERAFPVFVRDVAMARRYAYISDAKARFLERVWPGAVTVIFHHKEQLPPALTGGKDTLGLRMSAHPLVAALLDRLHVPLAQTSANISDMPAAAAAEDAAAYFRGRPDAPDLIVDGGVLPGSSSTVIDCTGDSPLVLRAGPVSKQDLDAMLSDNQ